MKLGHIVKYCDVFKFDNGPYRTMLSAVIDGEKLIRAYVSLFYCHAVLKNKFLILWPFVYENSPF